MKIGLEKKIRIIKTIVVNKYDNKLCSFGCEFLVDLGRDHKCGLFNKSLSNNLFEMKEHYGHKRCKVCLKAEEQIKKRRGIK